MPERIYLLLKYAEEHHILKGTEDLNLVMIIIKEHILKQHNHAISQRKDGRWFTRVGSKKTQYKLIVRAKKEDLEDAIVDYYIKERHLDISFEACYNECLTQAVLKKELAHKTKNDYDFTFNKYLANKEVVKKPIIEFTENNLKKLLKSIVNGDDIPQKRFSEVKTIINKTFEHASIELEMDVIKAREITTAYRPSSSRFRKPEEKEQVFYIDEIPKLHDVCISDNTLISLGILLVLNTGRRVGEICALDIKDIHEDYLEIRQAEITYTDLEGKRHTEIALPKENKIAKVTLSADAKLLVKKLLALHPTGQGFLFVTEAGKRATVRNFDTYIRKICKMADVPAKSMHKLRKTYCSVLLHSDYNEELVQSQLRHNDKRALREHYEYDVFRQNTKTQKLASSGVLTLVNAHLNEA